MVGAPPSPPPAFLRLLLPHLADDDSSSTTAKGRGPTALADARRLLGTVFVCERGFFSFLSSCAMQMKNVAGDSLTPKCTMSNPFLGLGLLVGDGLSRVVVSFAHFLKEKNHILTCHRSSGERRGGSKP
jgi:hypothetical protein